MQIMFLQIKECLTNGLFMMIKNYKIASFLSDSNLRETFETILHQARPPIFNTHLYNCLKFYKFGIN